MTEFFISYTSRDKGWAEWIAWQLEEAGHTTVIQAWDFAPGADFVLEMQKASSTAAQTIAILSPAYLEGRFTQPEWASAFAADPEGWERKLIPVRVEECKLGGLLKARVYIDLVGCDATTALERLLTGVTGERTKPSREPVFPGSGTVAHAPQPAFPGGLTRYVQPEPEAEKSEGETPLFALSIREHMASLNRHIEALTREQYRVIRLLSGMRRVRIAGCAGSGKTLVAAEKAVRLAGAGLRTLFLCHSPLLAAHVSALTRGTPVAVWAFGDWVSHLNRRSTVSSGSPWTNYDEPDSATLGSAFDVLSQIGGGYGAAIVDEGQDFRPEWWVLVEAALAVPEAGILYIFHDDHQALLPHRAAYPISEPVLDLSRNCRNAGRIFELVRYFHAQAPEPELHLKKKGHIFLIRVDRGQERAGLGQAMNSIYNSGLAEQAITVLLGGGLHATQWAAEGDSIELRTVEPWQKRVSDYFQRAMHHYDRRGLAPPKGGVNVGAKLARLSDEATPTAADVELVRQLARSFEVSGDIRRHILNQPQFRNALRWRADDQGLHLSRSSRSPLWSAEIIMHFEREDWPVGLSKPRLFRLVAGQHGTPGETLGLFDLSAFKGLEADVVILLAGGYHPMRTEEVYVAISRAVYALSIVDCGARLPLPPRF